MIVVSFLLMNNLCTNYFPVPPRENSIVFGAIPDCIIPLVKSGPKCSLDSPLLTTLTYLLTKVFSIPC